MKNNHLNDKIIKMKARIQKVRKERIDKTRKEENDRNVKKINSLFAGKNNRLSTIENGNEENSAVNELKKIRENIKSKAKSCSKLKCPQSTTSKLVSTSLQNRAKNFQSQVNDTLFGHFDQKVAFF